MQYRLSRCLGALLVLTYLPLTALAQPIPVGGEFQVHTVTTGQQREPQAAYDDQGNFFVVWFSGGPQDGSGSSIVGRRYGSRGNPLSGEFLVNTTTASDQRFPDVDIDGAGNAVVVWDGGPNGAAEIFAQRYDASGTPLGDEFQVNTYTTGNQAVARVSANDSGSFVVVWHSGGPPGGTDSRGRLYDSSGTPITGDFVLNAYTTGNQFTPKVDMAEDGSFLVAWTDNTQDGGIYGDTYGAFARRFDSAGSPIDATEFRLNAATTGIQSNPDVAFDPNGGFIATWADNNAPGGDGLDFDIVAQRFDDTATPVASEFLVNNITIGEQTSPNVAFDAAGNFMMGWTDGDDFGASGLDGQGTGIVARQFDSSGTPTSDAFVVNTFTTAGQFSPGLAVEEDGDFVLVWQSFGQDGSSSGTYGQLFTPAENSLIGHWPLDEASGTLAAESSGSGLDGNLESGASWTPGQLNSSSLFDGSNDLIRVVDSGADSPIDVTDSLTIALWVRPDNIDGSTQILVSKDNAYELEFGKNADAEWDLRLNNLVVASSPTPLQEGVWQHLAATWDGSTVTLYYNGLLDTSSPSFNTLIPNDDDLGFGARPSMPLVGPVFHFEGALDEIYLYNRALTGTAIAHLVLDSLSDVTPPMRSNLAPAISLPAGTSPITLSLDTDENSTCRYDTSFNISFDDMVGIFSTTGGTSHSTDVPVNDGQVFVFAVRCRDAMGNTNGDDEIIVFGVDDVDICSGRVSTWLLEEGSGCTTADANSSNNGTLGPNCPANAPLWTAGHLGGTLDFDGGDDLVTIPNDTTLATPTGLTLSAWIRDSGNSGFRALIDMRDSGADGYNLYLTPQSKPFIRVNSKTLTGQTSVADGSWHHVLGTYDGTTLNLYVDGLLDASAHVGPTSINVASDLLLGHHFTSTTNYSFGGDLSQAGVWGRALSPVEVFDFFSEMGTQSCAGVAPVSPMAPLAATGKAR